MDTRPRFKYTFPDGRVALIIRDHGDAPPARLDLELVQSDPLWATAERRPGTQRRFVWLTYAGAAS